MLDEDSCQIDIPIGKGRLQLTRETVISFNKWPFTLSLFLLPLIGVKMRSISHPYLTGLLPRLNDIWNA